MCPERQWWRQWHNERFRSGFQGRVWWVSKVTVTVLVASTCVYYSWSFNDHYSVLMMVRLWSKMLNNKQHRPVSYKDSCCTKCNFFLACQQIIPYSTCDLCAQMCHTGRCLQRGAIFTRVLNFMGSFGTNLRLSGWFYAFTIFTFRLTKVVMNCKQKCLRILQ